MSEYVFTSDWAEAFRENATNLFLPRAGEQLTYLEIGVWEGRSVCWMLDNVLTNPASYAECVDWKIQDVVWDNLKKHTYLSCGWPKVQLLQGNSRHIVPRLEGDFDMIYIDGDHSARGVLCDSVNCWRLCKKGGIILWDDYAKFTKDNKVKRGVEAFLHCIPKKHYKVMADNYQFAIMKKVDWN